MLSTCKNREECHFGDHKTLRELNLENGLKVGQGMVATYLYLLNVATNYKVKLSDLQISMLSETIYDKFFYLKDTEVMLFFSDFYKNVNSDVFFRSIEPNTIITMLTKWVRVKRSAAIEQHDKKLHSERLDSEMADSVSWEQYNIQKGIDEKDSPIGRISAGLACKANKETDESIRKSAEELVNNRWGYDKETMKKARKAFVIRYNYAPEYILRKE